MFFTLMNLMSMNILTAPELMRASTNMGVLLSTVLRHRGMSVPLQSKVDHMRKGSLEGCSGGCSGMACLVLRSMVTGDGGFNISLVDPPVLVSKTENLLVQWGMDFTINWLKN